MTMEEQEESFWIFKKLVEKNKTSGIGLSVS